MNEKRYPVLLSPEQRQALQHLIHTGKSTAHQQMAARVLLKADESNEQYFSSIQIAQALDISPRTIIHIKQRLVQQGLSTALTGNFPKELPLRRKVDGYLEAHLIALACGPAPQGHRRWTMQLLADRVVDVGIVDHIGDETIRLALNKELRPWLKRQWCFPRPGSDCVWHMEDVLDVYCRPYDANEPGVFRMIWARIWSRRNIHPNLQNQYKIAEKIIPMKRKGSATC